MTNIQTRFGRPDETISQIDRDSFAILDLEVPEGYERRAFLMRSAMATAIAALTGDTIVAFVQVPATAPMAGMSPNLDVVKRSNGPVIACA